LVGHSRAEADGAGHNRFFVYRRVNKDFSRSLTSSRCTCSLRCVVERLGKVINVSREGQLGMKAVLADSLARIEYDKRGRAVRLFPMLRRQDAPKSIVIDPRRAFGRPIMVGTAVPAADIRSRFDAGDSVEELARDFDVAPRLIEDALRATPQAA
jgi:uncharacterized protein (DUF433 family)